MTVPTLDHTATERLSLAHPTAADVDALHAVCSDPRVWTHFPSLRHRHRAETAAMVERWRADWTRDGLGTWVVRVDDEVVGYGGCARRGGAPGPAPAVGPSGAVWNLGYRLTPAVQGRGLATELARAAIRAARLVDDESPVVAYLLEHNRASLSVAERVGLRLVHRGPDAGNPDPDAVRLVLADRDLYPAELEVATR